MFGWSRKPTKADLHGHKEIKVCGMRFVIRRLNALTDFQPGQVPMVFSDTTRSKSIDWKSSAILKKLQEDMEQVVQAGVVEPEIVSAGKPGITASDLFRDQEMGTRLYAEIIEHSLLRFSGVRRPVFFLVRLLSRLMYWLGGTDSGLPTSHSAVSA